jgi:hypothetical protein
MKRGSQPVIDDVSDKKSTEKPKLLKYACDFDGCTYIADMALKVVKHKCDMHNIAIIWIPCIDPLCKLNEEFPKHIHDVDSKNYLCGCDQKDCTYSSLQKCSVKRHGQLIHKINPDIFYCAAEGCTHHSAQLSNLKQHILRFHTPDAEIFPCTFSGCKATPFKTLADMKRHIARRHDPNTPRIVCGINGCTHDAITPAEIKQHQSSIHDVGVTLYYCNIGDCNHYAKRIDSIKDHQARIHGIGCDWKFCPEDDCDYTTLTLAGIRTHLEWTHDIGEYQCELCIRACGKLNSWTCPILHTELQICRNCYRKNTNFTTRIEKVLVEWIQQNIPHPIIRQNQRVLGEACLQYRPDLMYADASGDTVIYIELDEYQHSRNNGSYDCDERRMSELYDETPGALVVFVRYNPHKYVPPKGIKKLKEEERRPFLVTIFNRIIAERETLFEQSPMHIFYLFYDMDNRRIAQNIPKTMIYQ